MKFKRMFALLLLAMGLVVANAAEAVVGEKGPVGDKGLTGNKGLPGDKGLTGNTGLPGAKGDAGLKGPVGDKGLTGNKGLPGDKGDAGLKGPGGDKGSIGDKGLTGNTGLTGPSGGAKGDKGLQGNIGPQGDKGEAGSMQSGSAEGDILYWDGSSWTLLPVGTNNSTLKVCNGVPTWVNNECPSFKIGDKGPAGGYVFYVFDNGAHGFEAGLVDLGPTTWGCTDTAIPDAEYPIESSSLGLGASETNAILNACSEPGIAARLAHEYTLNGYSDYFLPSFHELMELFKYKDNIGGFLSTNYWSSSEFSGIYVFVEDASGTTYKPKDEIKYVMPIRRF